MKNLKKVLATLTAMFMMLFCIGTVNVLAAGETYSITVTNTNTAQSIVGKTYSAYKLFDVTYSGSNYSYTISTSNPFYTNENAKAVLDTYFDFTDIASDTTTKTVTVKTDKQTGEDKTLSASDVRALADALQPYVSGTSAATAQATTQSVTLNVETAGYYIVTGTVKPTDPANSDKEVVSAVILTNAAPTANVNPKASVPTLDKKITTVKEGNSTVSDAVLDSAGQAAVAKVGSTVSYELDSIVPDLTGYSDYTFTFTDTLTKGLAYKTGTFMLKVGNAQAISIEPTFTSDNSGFTYTIPYATLKTYNKGDAIVLSYDATVTSEALSYDYANNTASIEYSKSPYSTETNKTPEKKTYILNINLDVKKVAEISSGSTLANASFKLRKSDTEYYKWDTTNNVVTWVNEDSADVFTTGENGNFTQQIRGLDKGTYYLVETVAPNGYNLLKDPVTVTITATEADNKVTYTASVGSDSAAVTNGVVDLTAAQNTNQPVATATIVNNAGSQLPSTGGMGTTLLYVVGGLLVAGAAIFFVTNKRMQKN